MAGRPWELAAGLASVALFFTAMNLSGAVLARYSRDLGVSLEATSLMWSLSSLASLVTRPFTGYLADRVGSWLVMGAGGALMAAASGAYMASRGLGGLSAGRILQGLASGFFIAPSMVAVASAAGERAGLALGYRSMMISLASLVAPPVAGYVADSLGYTWAFALALLVALAIPPLCLPHARRAPRGRGPSGYGWGDALNWRVALTTATAAVMGAIFMSLTGLLQAHYRDLGYPASTYGVLMMLAGLSGLASRYLSGRLTLRVNPAITAVGGEAVVAASLLLFSRHYRVPAAYLAALLYGFGYGLVPPSTQLLTLESVPGGVANTALSIYAMGFDAGAFLGPIAYGALAARHGYQAAYAGMGLLALAGTPLLGPLLRCRGRRGHVPTRGTP
ncbi:MAG: MFS transporter [Desulfurococcales archaeon]|nr:MFS transporter [Desulfurococcales archaeon]